MSFCGTSPGTGVQLRSGRLVVPIYYNGEHKRHFSAAVVYSDDGGATCKRGKSPNDGRIFEGRQIDSRTFNPAHYVYQCMTILPDGTLGLLWEREMQGLYFTRIPLEWIEAAKYRRASGWLP